MIIMFLVLFFVPAVVLSQQIEPQQLRGLYYDASTSEEAAHELHELLAKVDKTSSPLLLGYKGMAEFMICYHAKNPLTKITSFIKGRQTLDQSIALDPENVELRFLRFTVQTNAPRFLGYWYEIPQDKARILAALDEHDESTDDSDLARRMVEYMKETRFCTAEEKDRIAKYE